MGTWVRLSLFEFSLPFFFPLASVGGHIHFRQRGCICLDHSRMIMNLFVTQTQIPEPFIQVALLLSSAFGRSRNYLDVPISTGVAIPNILGWCIFFLMTVCSRLLFRISVIAA